MSCTVVLTPSTLPSAAMHRWLMHCTRRPSETTPCRISTVSASVKTATGGTQRSGPGNAAIGCPTTSTSGGRPSSAAATGVIVRTRLDVSVVTSPACAGATALLPPFAESSGKMVARRARSICASVTVSGVAPMSAIAAIERDADRASAPPAAAAGYRFDRCYCLHVYPLRAPRHPYTRTRTAVVSSPTPHCGRIMPGAMPQGYYGPGRNLTPEAPLHAMAKSVCGEYRGLP